MPQQNQKKPSWDKQEEKVLEEALSTFSNQEPDSDQASDFVKRISQGTASSMSPLSAYLNGHIKSTACQHQMQALMQSLIIQPILDGDGEDEEKEDRRELAFRSDREALYALLCTPVTLDKSGDTGSVLVLWARDQLAPEMHAWVTTWVHATLHVNKKYPNGWGDCQLFGLSLSLPASSDDTPTKTTLLTLWNENQLAEKVSAAVTQWVKVTMHSRRNMTDLQRQQPCRDINNRFSLRELNKYHESHLVFRLLDWWMAGSLSTEKQDEVTQWIKETADDPKKWSSLQRFPVLVQQKTGQQIIGLLFSVWGYLGGMHGQITTR